MRLNTTSNAMTALTMPAPESAGITGWNVPATKSITASSGLFFSAATGVSALEPVAPTSFSTSSNTLATCGPMTTWNCPPPWMTPMVPSSALIASSSAFPSSARMKRSRVTQWYAWLTFSLPPTRRTMSCAKGSYFELIDAPSLVSAGSRMRDRRRCSNSMAAHPAVDQQFREEANGWGCLGAHVKQGFAASPGKALVRETT